MAHKIEQPFDIVFSDKGTEWHELATVCERLDALTVEPLFFKIRETESIEGTIDVDGSPQTISFPQSKGIVADLRHRKDIPQEAQFVPLKVMTEDYKVLENEPIFQAILKSMEGVEHSITTAGTLDKCRRFFVSVALGAENRGFSAAGDQFLSYINFMTSHDGSLALQLFDSNTRIVCNNTLNMSLYGKKTLHVKIRHTSGADVELSHASEYLNSLLTVREYFVEDLERLAEKKVTHEEAYDGYTGWQHSRVGKPEKSFSSRSKNTIDGIHHLFLSGKGNNGQTRYDVWNGFTEYYSQGDGVGKTVKPEQRIANGRYGHASQLKAQFTERLFKQDGWEELVQIGRAVNGRGTQVFMAAQDEGLVGVN